MASTLSCPLCHGFPQLPWLSLVKDSPACVTLCGGISSPSAWNFSFHSGFIKVQVKGHLFQEAFRKQACLLSSRLSLGTCGDLGCCLAPWCLVAEYLRQGLVSPFPAPGDRGLEKRKNQLGRGSTGSEPSCGACLRPQDVQSLCGNVLQPDGAAASWVRAPTGDGRVGGATCFQGQRSKELQPPKTRGPTCAPTRPLPCCAV